MSIVCLNSLNTCYHLHVYYLVLAPFQFLLTSYYYRMHETIFHKWSPIWRLASPTCMLFHFLNMSFIIAWNVAGELHNPKYMTVGSNRPHSVMKAAFHSSPSLIRTLLKPHRRSIFVKYLAPCSLAIKSSILGNGNLYLILILLMALESVHILQPPSFFGLSTVGTAQGLRVSLINPLSSNSCTCFLTSSFSAGVILYAALLGRLATGIKY